jgi:hypothetical protein
VQAIKTIGASGQSSSPANERWLHEPQVVESLDRGLRWAAENPPAETDLDDLERRLAK